MARRFKIIVEKRSDGYVAYRRGLKGVVIGQGSSYKEALADVKSAIRFHIETFGEKSCLTSPAGRSVHSGSNHLRLKWPNSRWMLPNRE